MPEGEAEEGGEDVEAEAPEVPATERLRDRAREVIMSRSPVAINRTRALSGTKKQMAASSSQSTPPPNFLTLPMYTPQRQFAETWTAV